MPKSLPVLNKRCRKRRKRLNPPSPPFSAGGGSMAKRQVRTRRNVSPIDRVNRQRQSALATREIAGKTVAPVRSRHGQHPPTRLAFIRMSTNCLSAIHSLHRKVSLGLDRKSVVSGESVSVRVDTGGARTT